MELYFLYSLILRDITALEEINPALLCSAFGL